MKQIGVCLSSCPSGYYGTRYPDINKCTKCKADCDTCFNKNFCTKCKSGFYLHLGKCFDSCPEGLEANNHTMECISIVTRAQGYEHLGSRCYSEGENSIGKLRVPWARTAGAFDAAVTLAAGTAFPISTDKLQDRPGCHSTENRTRSVGCTAKPVNGALGVHAPRKGKHAASKEELKLGSEKSSSILQQRVTCVLLQVRRGSVQCRGRSVRRENESLHIRSPLRRNTHSLDNNAVILTSKILPESFLPILRNNISLLISRNARQAEYAVTGKKGRERKRKKLNKEESKEAVPDNKGLESTRDSPENKERENKEKQQQKKRKVQDKQQKSVSVSTVH
ncbi:R-spondin-3 [Fukomys damarensis]|uniref:R-spondin-3 n=1 Tax=Fukomys damarensis TaxID=885580 RepID=A0A091DQ30_FUKDA|nr:R-spondin-3 [Fukomys damarensis]